MRFNLEVPINPLSLGQIGFGILLDLFKRGINPNIFPIGPVQLNSFNIPPQFENWLKENISNSLERYKKSDTTITLWHINGSHKRLSDKTILWTAHETDQLTETEKNILLMYDQVLVTSSYSKNVFQESGVNADVCFNFFDKHHFHKVEREYKGFEDVTTYSLIGKMEKRKLTIPIILAWAKCFGGSHKHRLNCSIHNHFMKPEQQQQMIENNFGGQVPFNINILPFTEKNSKFNEVMNAADVDLSGLSGAEGWNLPHFNMLCLGKQAISLDEHAHRDYTGESGAKLVSPLRKQEIYDGMFFKKGDKFNQGNMFTWREDEVIKSILEIDKVAKERNTDGEKLKDKFTVEFTVDKLLSYV